MSADERSFWENFLGKVGAAIDEEVEKGTARPYKFSAELFAEFQTAVTRHEGDKYCQVNQIRGLFDTNAPAAAH